MNVQFFYDNAGYSHNPATETPEQGRMRCAEALARAEVQGRERGLCFSWEVDQGVDSSDFNDEEPAYALWGCCCHTRTGDVLASLGAVDFGPDGEPAGAYARVVEAELALEAIADEEGNYAGREGG